MVKRALLLVAAVAAVTAVGAFTVSPISPQVARAASTAKAIVARPNARAPRTRAHALKILSVNVMKLALDYKRKHYRAVCADLTTKELKHLGGTSQCMPKIALINALVPIRKFTIASTKFNKSRVRAGVSLYINGAKKHLVHAAVKWEGGAYRLDHMSGWKPAL